MDFQNRVGARTGTTGMHSISDANLMRRERQRRLALETIDISKDPYIFKNHLGSYECRLCLTVHTNEGSYLAHTQGKKHQMNLARRKAKEQQEMPMIEPSVAIPKMRTPKIGKPAFKVTKIRHPISGQNSILFELFYQAIHHNWKPRHRFMSTFEQKIEPPDNKFMFILFAAEPYNTVAFKLPNQDLDKADDKYYEEWDRHKKKYSVHISYKI